VELVVDWTGFAFPKPGEVRFKGEEYEEFKRQIFERDNWMCRNLNCKSRRNLTVHHKIKRSKRRLDIPENCITLCVNCHDLVEAGKLNVKTGGLGN